MQNHKKKRKKLRATRPGLFGNDFFFFKNIIRIVNMLFASIILKKTFQTTHFSNISYILDIVVVKKIKSMFFIQKLIFNLRHLEKDKHLKNKIHKWP